MPFDNIIRQHIGSVSNPGLVILFRQISGCGNMNSKIILSTISLAIFLASCVTPNVDQTSTTFDKNKYASDLDTCRGGNIVEATASTIGVGLVGSAIGAATVATYGAIAANSGEAIVAGAIVGGVIGIGKGAADAVEEHNGKIADCLRSKGYQIVATLR